MDYEVRDTNAADLLWLATYMRQADKDEVAAASGFTSSQTMLLGMYNSPFMKTGLVDGVPVIIFGAAPHADDDRIGVPWMLATDMLTAPKCKRIMLRHSRKWIEEVQKLYPVLANITDKRNKAHHRWIQWCGFTFINEVYRGPCNAPFLQFVRIRNV